MPPLFPGRPRLLVPAALLLVSLACGRAGPPDVCGPGPGVLVEAVEEGSVPARGGLEVGDRVVGWRRGDLGGRIGSVVDWRRVEIEEAPRGPIRLELGSDGGRRRLEIPAGRWEVGVRPPLAPPLLAAYRRLRHPGTEETPPGEGEILALLPADADPCLRWWLAYAAGRWSGKRRDPRAARRWFERATDVAPDPFARGLAWEGVGDVRQGENDLDGAQAAFEKALAAWVEAGPQSLAVARAWLDLAGVHWVAGRLDEAEAALSQGLALEDALAPGGYLVAGTHNGLGAIALQRGDLAAAQGELEKALALREAGDPGGLAVAASLNDLGVVARRRGDYGEAERCYRRSLAVREARAPGSVDVAASLTNLGVVAEERGDLELAEARYRRALAIYRNRAPGSPEEAAVLSDLGVVARVRGDLDGAEEVQRRALALRERIAPDNPDVARILDELGQLGRQRGDLAGAEDLLRRALAVEDRAGAGGVERLETLGNLGGVLAERGASAAARDLLEKALAIARRVAPGSLREAAVLDGLARVEATRSPRRARELLARAVAALDQQVGRLGGTPAREEGLRAQFADTYHRYVAALVSAGEPAGAFTALERYRARGFLRTLAQRDLLFPRDLPPALAARRARLAASFDALQARLLALDPEHDGARIDRLRLDLAEEEGHRLELAAELRDASPRLGELVDPQPATAAEVLEQLPPGTALVAFSTGTDALEVLALRRGAAVEARTVPQGEASLRREVETFRGLLQEGAGGGDLGRLRRSAVDAARRTLYGELLGPVAGALAGADRLLLLPDGPLHLLPFAALLAPDGSSLAEHHAIAIAPSATAWLALRRARSRRARGPSPGLDLVAFGDPAGAGSRPLPAARREVAALAALFPGSARTFVGTEATEAAVKAEAGRARYLHFATHARLDDHLPLDAALVLAPSPGENGLLQSWEVLEQLRIPADLVVLSGCATALGAESGGEGLLSLERAFHFAGAPAVVASLWDVRDEAAARLMVEFYRGLRQGFPADRALAAAERRLRAAGAPPGVWAAFELYGDPG